MSGFQFVHFETFSRKSNSKGQSISFVLDEAERKSLSSLHVETPLPPVLVYGLDISGVRALHEERSESSTVKYGGKQRRTRVDQHTLATVIASHPITPADYANGGELADDYDKWEKRTILWLKETYGTDMVSVIRHVDERYLHIHAYVVPSEIGMRARAFHCGVVAKEKTVAEAKRMGVSPGEANKLGDKSYRAAMRAWQDVYFEKVGIASGLSRLGPHRRRLTRDAWKAEQAQVAHASTAIAAADAAMVQRDLTLFNLQVTAEKARAYVASARAAADLAKVSADVQTARAVAARAESEGARRQAALIVSKARKEAHQVVAKAERTAARLSRIGERLGGLWSGLSGVQRRLERVAAERVLKAEARAAGAVAEAKSAVRSEFGGELDRLKSDADRLKAEAEASAKVAVAAKAAEAAAKVQCGRERSGRLVAETQREDFRGRWADADNENISLRKALGHS